MQRNAYFSSDKTLIEHWNAIELPRKIISQTWQTLSLTILISGYALGGALHTSQQKNVDPSPSLEALEFRIWLVFEDQELIIDPKDLSKQQVFVIHCLYWPLWHQFQHVHDLTLLYQTLLSCQFRLFFFQFLQYMLFLPDCLELRFFDWQLTTRPHLSPKVLNSDSRPKLASSIMAT